MNAPPALTKQVGPMPLWGWFIVGGGVLVLVFFHKAPAVAAVTNPNTATPAPPLSPPTIVPGGSGVYDVNTGQSVAPVSLSDLLGGKAMGDFLNTLGPNFQQFAVQVGNAGLTLQNSPQNVLDAQALSEQYAYETVMNQPHILEPNQALVTNSGDIFAGFQQNTDANGAKTIVGQTYGSGPDAISQMWRLHAAQSGVNPDQVATLYTVPA